MVLWSILALLTPSVIAKADLLPMAQSLEATSNDSVSAGKNYNLGLTLDMGLGDKDDPSNVTGDVHGNYSRQLSLQNPSDLGSPPKHVNNWAGGVLINPLDAFSLGLDIDSSSDRFESLFTDGVKVTLGYDPFKLSYRYARSTLLATVTFANVVGKKLVVSSLPGAFIYQQTLELECDANISESDQLTLTVAGSVFSPDAPQFAAALQLQGLANLSSFQDTLGSFYQYEYGPEWKHNFSDSLDAKASFKLSHEVITANTLLQTSTSVGYRVAPFAHVALGWDYSHDATQVQNTATLELRISWDRSMGQSEAEGGKKPRPRAADLRSRALPGALPGGGGNASPRRQTTSPPADDSDSEDADETSQDGPT